tara:strand:- start:4494 stop:5579 length:1086 start_codon:yes stop_codon:yes gene_type:complete
MKYIIGGAGIAGLCLANFLEKESLTYFLVDDENIKDRQTNTGIQLAPNCHYIFKKLGIYKDIITASCSANELILFDRKSKFKNKIYVKNIDDQGPIFIKRGDLINILKKNIPNQKFRNHKITKFTQTNEKVYLQLGKNEQECDYFINSMGSKDFKTKSLDGSSAIWGVGLSREKVFHGLNLYMYNGFHIVTYPLPDNTIAFTINLAKRKKNFLNMKDQKLSKPFYNYLPPYLSNLIKSSKDFIYRDLSSSNNNYWGEERVVNIGDAAHPMLPHLAQGASQALIDADLVGEYINASSLKDIHTNLRLRNKLVNKIKLTSRINKLIYQLPMPMSLFRNVFLLLYKPDFSWLYNSKYGFKRKFK